jgi:GNAT superfamily N-acetyltransferase
MRLLRELPASIHQLDAYLNIENLSGRRFYAERGFQEREHRSYDFWLRPEDRVLFDDTGCFPLEPQHEASFKQLYEALFPNAYYSAERVIDMIGTSHQVFVLVEGGKVSGFAVVSLEEGPSTGEIQFLGVREECRRRGYGRRLLLCAITWLLDRASVALVCLNVAEELVHARALYESAGFQLRFTGIGLEKKGFA